MSAICAVWSPETALSPVQLQSAMRAAEAFYGEAPFTSWSDGSIALGRSLTPILPEDSFDRQPLWARDRSCCLVADVRLDNRGDLTRELGLIHPEELADSDILLAAWLRWGEACLDHLLGGFAFAVWTPARQELFAARDHAGERPLFYHRSDSVVAVASLPRTLLGFPGAARGFDEERLLGWLTSVEPPRAHSCFEGIGRLLPGHLVRFAPGRIECRQYWHPSWAKETRYRRDEEYADTLVELLDRATEARLRGIGEVGSHLSAGLDSSSVTASAARLLALQGRRLTAFTAVPRPEFDNRAQAQHLPSEGAAAAELTRMYANIDHVLVDSRGYPLLPTMQWWSETTSEPARNVTNLLWYQAILDQARQRGIRIMLEAAAGNAGLSWTTFSVLGSFLRRGQWLRLLRTAHSLRHHGEISIRTAAWFSLGNLVPAWCRRKLIQGTHFGGTYSPLASEKALRTGNIAARIEQNLTGVPLTPLQEQTRLYELVDSAPIRIAAEGLTGVVIRDPAGDKRLYEFCFSIPPEQYVLGGHSRSLVRRAMKGRLPEQTRLRYLRGHQGADWYITMQEAMPDLRRELALQRRSASAREYLDLDRMERLLDTWPDSGYETSAVSYVWHLALLRAISLGSFLRTHESFVSGEQASAASPSSVGTGLPSTVPAPFAPPKQDHTDTMSTQQNRANAEAAINLGDQRPERRFVFGFGPFRLESEIDIPALRSAALAATRRVAVRVGGVPESIEGAPYGQQCTVNAVEYLLRIPKVASYYVGHGNEVRIEAEPGASNADVTAYLLGPLFGVLCHQNGLLPLHASAIEHNGIVTAFVGNSGAGKSTFAACLRQRGHRIVSDDICLLEPAQDAMRVIPVAEWLKLWTESLDHLGESPAEEHRVFSTDDKFRLHLAAPAVAEARLGRIVFLAKSGHPQAAQTLERLTTLEAVAGLFDMTYVSYVPVLSGQKARIFQQCARALSHAEAFRLTRPWGLERMDEALDLVERTVLRDEATSP